MPPRWQASPIAVAAAELDHLVDVVVHRLLHPRRSAESVARLERLEAHRQQRRAPSAVATAGAEADRVSRSTTATRSAGWRCSRCHAVQRPVSPAPTIATSASTSRGQLRIHRALVVGNRVGPQRASLDRGHPSTLCAVGRPRGRRATHLIRPLMNALPPPTTAPAGWYPDPTSDGRMRYFDGRAWAPVGPVFEEREAHPAAPDGRRHRRAR